MEPRNSGAPLPYDGKGRWWKIIAPKAGHLIRGCILGDTFHGVWTHFVPPTQPCTMTADCHYCRGGLAPRYFGYAPFRQFIDKTDYVLALTYGACLQLVPQLEKHGSLRGLGVEVFRKNSNAKSAVIVRPTGIVQADKVPPAFDVIDSLSRMWGVNAEYLKRGCRRLHAGENPADHMQHRIAMAEALAWPSDTTQEGQQHEPARDEAGDQDAAGRTPVVRVVEPGHGAGLLWKNARRGSGESPDPV